MGTFLRWEGSYFHHLMASDWNPDKNGEFFIDRDPQHFGRVMESLRSGKPIGVVGLRVDQVAQLRIESDYYQLPMSEPELLMNNVLVWDPDNKSLHLSISEEGRTVEKIGHMENLVSGVLGKPSDVARFQVRVRKGDENMYCMIGYSTVIDFAEDTYSNVAEGYFLDSDGALWEPGEDCYRGGYPPLKQGDLVAAFLNR